ncbi:Acetylglutamate kinase [bacterium HR29]|jgi:acetylglutamate kinase|nr:Acetylglutamate kinase [bacterium HR29]
MSAPFVIKVGGSTIDRGEAGIEGIAALAKSGERVVVVHGGGPEATRWLEAMGIPTRFERGRRVTDERVLPVVAAVFAGLVNKRLVAALAEARVSAVGVSGVDGGLLPCRIADPELGFVGEPETPNPAVLEALLAAGFVPVVAPIGFVRAADRTELVNVNADTVAAALGAALRATEVNFLTDVEAVRGRRGEPLTALTASEARALIAEGVIAGGMIPKVEACLAAAARGVPARILHARDAARLAAGTPPGTLVLPER